MLRERRVEPSQHILDHCRIRWGEVQDVSGDRATVLGLPLHWDGATLDYGPPALEEVSWAEQGRSPLGTLEPGDQVALHWDWVCDHPDPGRLDHLQRWTRHRLDLVNPRP